MSLSYREFIKTAIQHANDAAAKDEAKDYDGALWSYERAIEYFMTAIKHERNNPNKKEALKEKCVLLMDRTEQIKAYQLRKLQEQKHSQW